MLGVISGDTFLGCRRHWRAPRQLWLMASARVSLGGGRLDADSPKSTSGGGRRRLRGSSRGPLSAVGLCAGCRVLFLAFFTIKKNKHTRTISSGAGGGGGGGIDASRLGAGRQDQ
jgi:hypothetical protein